MPLEEWQRLTDRGEGVQGGSRVREIVPVGCDRRLQITPEEARIIGPVEAERRVDHRHQDLQFQPRGRAELLSTRRYIGASVEIRLRKLGVQLIHTTGIELELGRESWLVY